MQIPFRKPDPIISVIELVMKGNEITVDNTQALDPEIGTNELSVILLKQKTAMYTNQAGWKNSESGNMNIVSAT